VTTVSVLADPPREGLVLPGLYETGLLSPSEAADLYGAMLADVCLAVERSGGELLVNYRPAELLPDEHADVNAESAVRSALEGVLEEPPRTEVQVGSTFAARAGNTTTHLLEQEGVDSVAIVEPTAPLLSRSHVDNAAMKLRLNPVVLGPATGGRVYYTGFTEPIDFENAYEPPAVETLTWRGRDAGHEVDFLPVVPTVETPDDLATVVSLIRARLAADRIVPVHTATWIDENDLRVEDGSLVTE
jgi:2-phospho-L-lactate guanylyltransferase (CobY/MobA/RfbA family)